MSSFAVGSLVRFRGRDWLVVSSEDEKLLTLRPLSGGEEDLCGVYLPLESEKLEPTTFPRPSLEDIGDFESARLLRDAARLLLRQGAGPFRSMGYLSVRPRPYQFVPLLMALRLKPVRMLIADDVGIGKTIEAALIARELLDRGEARRLAVICPPYLCDQWQTELRDKFHLDAVIIRTNTLVRLERKLPRPNLSVFEYYPYTVVSVDFVKSERRRDAFLLHCPDLVIVDEAHGCARPPGQSKTQQQRHELISDLAVDESRHLLLVTATPHSGFEESFLSLLGFIRSDFSALDFESIEKEQRTELTRHFIQRRRADVKQWMGTETRFPERESFEISFLLSPEYNQLFKDVYRFARGLVLGEESQSRIRRRARYWAALALLRCVMSSPAAAVAALRSRIERLASDEEGEETDYTASVYDPMEVEWLEDMVPIHAVDDSRVDFSDTDKRKLREFSRRAEDLKGSHDTKIQKTEQEIRSLLEEGYKPIVYCRYIATSDYVAEELQKRLGREYPDLHVISVTSTDSDDLREIRVKELCKSKPRVLVATDCLSEGVNLQEGFNAVLHYDLPWNPNRLEQREGRVDRFGQSSEKVKAILLYGADNPIDGAVLKVLLRKARHIHRNLGITVPIPVNSESVMETVLTALFLRDIQHEQLDLFDDEAPIVEVHRQWDRAVERERKSRTMFAQHAIKPGEVAKELETADSILGSPEVVETFVKTACQRLGSSLKGSTKRYKLDITLLPEVIRSKISDGTFLKITFDQPPREGIEFISRNHPLTNTLAEYLFGMAMRKDGDRNLSSRCGVIRSRDVDSTTIILVIRFRFIVSWANEGKSSIAEECHVIGFEGLDDEGDWLSREESERLFKRVRATGNLTFSEKEHWVSSVLDNPDGSVNDKIREVAFERARCHEESYHRLRKVTRGPRISVEPQLPADILSLSIILPHPE